MLVIERPLHLKNYTVWHQEQLEQYNGLGIYPLQNICIIDSDRTSKNNYLYLVCIKLPDSCRYNTMTFGQVLFHVVS